MDTITNATIAVTNAVLATVTTASGLGAGEAVTTEISDEPVYTASAQTMEPGTCEIKNCFTTFDNAFSTETGCVWFTISLIWAVLSIVIILILLIALCCYCCRGSGSDNES